MRKGVVSRARGRTSSKRALMGRRQNLKQKGVVGTSCRRCRNDVVSKVFVGGVKFGHVDGCTGHCVPWNSSVGNRLVVRPIVRLDLGLIDGLSLSSDLSLVSRLRLENRSGRESGLKPSNRLRVIYVHFSWIVARTHCRAAREDGCHVREGGHRGHGCRAQGGYTSCNTPSINSGLGSRVVHYRPGARHRSRGRALRRGSVPGRSSTTIVV